LREGIIDGVLDAIVELRDLSNSEGLEDFLARSGFILMVPFFLFEASLDRMFFFMAEDHTGGSATMMSFKGAHFVKAIILTCVRWYIAFPYATAARVSSCWRSRGEFMVACLRSTLRAPAR
jgi:hypothetical protein